MKLAMTMLCENPQHRTGLSTTFYEFASRALRLCPEVSWVLFAGPGQEVNLEGPRVQIVRDFPANDRLGRRLIADQLQVAPRAKALGAEALITVGFVPLIKSLPTIMHIFGLQHLDRDNRLGLMRELYRRFTTHYSWHRADLIFITSDYARDRFLALFPELSSRLIRTYEGLKHEQYHPDSSAKEVAELRSELGLEPGYFLWVSNLYPYKQIHLLLEAYAELTTEERERHPLVIVGGNWLGVLEEMTALGRRLGIEKNVRFPGWIEERWLAPLYRHALAYCLSSREETFGRTVTEAQACGTPCLVHDISVMREVTGGAAIIVDFNDRATVIAALRRLMNDESERSRLRQEGLANVQRFSFDTLTIERIEAIRRLLKRPLTS